MKLNNFGKEMRRLRLDHDELLKDMAAKLNVTPAFLSSLETGRKPVPGDFVTRVAREYRLPVAVRERLQSLADATRTSFEIKLDASSSARYREAAAVLARKFPRLNAADVDALMDLMHRRGG
jgi:HTH-type transcriptional regulator, competence development regulator